MNIIIAEAVNSILLTIILAVVGFLFWRFLKETELGYWFIYKITGKLLIPNQTLIDDYIEEKK